MKKRTFIYVIITILFILASLLILSNTDFNNSVMLCNSIEVIIILYLIRISYGCIVYIKNRYEKKNFDYSVILNLGLFIFININLLRIINLFISNINNTSIVSIYTHTLESFKFFAMLTLPCIIVLSVYSIISNIVLIKKEGYSYRNMLGIGLGVLSILGLFLGQAIYLFTSTLNLTSEKLFIKLFVDIQINAVFSYIYSLIIATLYCSVISSRHNPKYDKDYVIILGSKVGSDGEVTPLLRGRIDRAIKFAKDQKENNNKDIIYIPSGGQGKDEVISEAEAIKNYLIKQGIDKKHIIIENKSTSTYENMKFSKNIIDKEKKDAKIAFSTTNYHVFRSAVIANSQGIDIEGMGSKTKWYYYSNALIREFIINLYEDRKKHLLLLLIINILIFILILIGYNNHFFFS